MEKKKKLNYDILSQNDKKGSHYYDIKIKLELKTLTKILN